MRLSCYYFFNWQRTNQINRIFMHLNVHHFPNSKISFSIFYKVSKSQLHLNGLPSPPCFLEPQRNATGGKSRGEAGCVAHTRVSNSFIPPEKNIFFLSLLPPAQDHIHTSRVSAPFLTHPFLDFIYFFRRDLKLLQIVSIEICHI